MGLTLTYGSLGSMSGNYTKLRVRRIGLLDAQISSQLASRLAVSTLRLVVKLTTEQMLCFIPTIKLVVGA